MQANELLEVGTDPDAVPLHFSKAQALFAQGFFQAYDFQDILFYNPEVVVKHKLKTDRSCRFCQKQMPDVTFKKDAHIYPEFIGNRKLVSDFECDECNSIFSKLENDLNHFLGPVLALQGIQGKKKKGRGRDVSYTAPDNRLKIEPIKLEDGTKGIAVSKADLGDPSITINHSGGETYIEYTKHDYIPLNVYKLLLKMAVCSLPEAEMKNYPSLPAYLLDDSLDEKMNGCQFMTIHRKPFSLGHRAPIGNLFKKRDKNRLLPTHVFVLMFANFVVQIYLPEHLDDIPLIYESGKLPEIAPILPPFFYSRKEADTLAYTSTNYMMNSKDTVEKELERISMQNNPQALAKAHVYNAYTDASVPVENFGETMKLLLFEEQKIISKTQLKELAKKAAQLGPKRKQASENQDETSTTD
ncbi:HNH endonuclease [Sediminibacterium roseum]|uniref:HNH endonuclease n=1 Tax=Sediminibacterium roseum TaxID=1978412 RepID=A0ABX0A1T5_9BACT|nr:HNH endonuclease [Sediminibacterium roseum]NCI51353.1 HNH endonuclease [Sediminibacterium roseum]